MGRSTSGDKYHGHRPEHVPILCMRCVPRMRGVSNAAKMCGIVVWPEIDGSL